MIRIFSFLNNRQGTPSVETVAIIAFVALAIFSNLNGLGDAIGSVFDYVGNQLTNQIQ